MVKYYRIDTSTSCLPPPPPDPTLTSDNLLTVMKDVQDWDQLGKWLSIPASKRVLEISQHHPTDSQRKVTLLTHWLHTHPAPSWKRVATALRLMDKYSLAEVVTTKYVRGMFVMMFCYVMSVCVQPFKMIYQAISHMGYTVASPVTQSSPRFILAIRNG